MSKEKNDLFIVIIFSLIWIVRSISYDEMRSRHPIYPQENVVLINSSSIPTENDEFEFLESNTKEIILAKGTSGSFFIEGFTSPLPRRPSSTGSQTAMGMSGSNPGQGGGNSNPSSGSEAGSCSSNLPDPNPKIAARIDDRSYVKSKTQNKKAKNKNYSQIMDELDNQRNKKVVVVEIDGKIYTIKNPYNDGADELAKKLYDDFPKDNKDVCEIAEKNTLKKENVQKCKDHIFYNEHLLDQYEELGEPAEYRRFDPNLKQALAWQPFKDGIPTKDDIEWLRHEFVEQAYESKNNVGYRDSHNYAQSRYNGDPWIEEWDNRN